MLVPPAGCSGWRGRLECTRADPPRRDGDQRRSRRREESASGFSPMADTLPNHDSDSDVAVLASGGIDSAVLCIDLLREFARVHPLYVRFGLRWEEVELAGLRSFLAAAPRPGLRPLEVLEEPMADVYGRAHWS